MKLEDVLNEKKKAILDGWFQAALESYHPDSINFFKNKKDQFQNPVGHTLSEGMGVILDEILGEFRREQMADPLDRIIKIRSVQDFSAADAVSFMFQLKDVVRNIAGEAISQHHLEESLYKFDARVDRLVLYAFENYTRCREKLYQIRIDQVKAGGFRILDRLNRKPESADGDSGEKIENN